MKGAIVGTAVGDDVGAIVGTAVGDDVGAIVGMAVGDDVGAIVGMDELAISDGRLEGVLEESLFVGFMDDDGRSEGMGVVGLGVIIKDGG
jgi:hypothetical protein